jgi:dolichol-phosphate mannosyltransferase
LRRTIGLTKLLNNQLFRKRLSDRWKIIFNFALVGASGAVINLFILWFLTKFGSLHYICSAIVAIEVSIFWNFYLNSKITFNYKFRDRMDVVSAVFKYHLASLAGTLINILALFILTEYFNIFYLFSEIMAIFSAFGINYFISKNLVWNSKKRP